MIKIKPEFLAKVHAADKPEDLINVMQKAIELEHSTIPPYLTAMFSLKPGRNREIWGIIHSVVLEEMLHMTIASNILIALGGDPNFIDKDFVPKYPGTLPMNIACEDPKSKDCLNVSLAGFSRYQVGNVFMRIEEPEDPMEFEVKPVRNEQVANSNDQANSEEPDDQPYFATIGAFYAAIEKKLLSFGRDTVLPGSNRKQVTPIDYFSSDECFRIETVQNAVDAINIIVEQGEGADHGKDPIDEEGELGHYYRFAEIYHGRRLVEDEKAPGGYSYSGDAFPFEVDGVWNLQPNTKTENLPDGSPQRLQAEQFNYVYRKLLLSLHRAFNGEPDKFDATIGLMYDLKLAGEKLVAMPYLDKVGVNCGPPFEYTTLNGMPPKKAEATALTEN